MASASRGNLPPMAPRQLAIISAALIVIGCVLAAVATATALDAIGITVAGIGLVGLVSAAFYAVGQSEDRARGRGGGGRGRPRRGPEGRRPGAPPPPPRRPAADAALVPARPVRTRPHGGRRDSLAGCVVGE